MFKRERIISMVLLLMMAGVFLGVYQFYFKDKLAAYKQNEDFHGQLVAALDTMSKTFHGSNPELAVEAWSAQVNPWSDARRQRAGYFMFGDWLKVDEYPKKDAPMVRFWYEERLNKNFEAFLQDIAKRFNTLKAFPPTDQLVRDFGVLMPSEFTGVEVTEPMVTTELKKLSFGFRACTFLCESQPTAVYGVYPWPEQKLPAYKDALTTRYTGYRFQMRMKDLVAFLEKLRLSERYFSVDALKISYSYLAYPVEPEMMVDMLVSQLAYARNLDEELSGPAPAAGAVSTPGAPGAASPGLASAGAASAGAQSAASGDDDDRFGRRRRGSAPTQEPTSTAGRAWKWFKRNVLYTN